MAGRAKGKKNLQYKNGKIINQYGINFTVEEKKNLESLVNSANRKRRRMLKEESNLPYILGGKQTGKTIGETVGKMGKESDFILAKKTKSLQRFRNRQEYNKYVANLERVVQRDYIDKRVELYKENHLKALKNAFGNDAASIIKSIKKLSAKEYMKLVQSDELLQISYIYDPQQRAGKLMQIKNALGINKNAKNGRGLRNNNRPK